MYMQFAVPVVLYSVLYNLLLAGFLFLLWMEVRCLRFLWCLWHAQLWPQGVSLSCYIFIVVIFLLVSWSCGDIV